MNNLNPPKPKKCRNCKELFQPARPLQVACSTTCAMALARAKGAKKARKEVKEGLERLKGRKDRVRELDMAFGAFIRYRDKDKTCVCCGEPLGNSSVGGGYDCGHYISRRHYATRWDESNCAGQRKYCNRWKGGNVQGFRAGLIERIGLDEVLRLEAAKEVEANISTDEIIRLTAVYKDKLKELKKD